MIAPCDCRRSAAAAATCPREVRGTLVWTQSGEAGGQPVGAMAVVPLIGEPEALTFGHEWLHVSERVARDHARIRHLSFAGGH